jgi:proteasome-associated ATPase
VDDVPSRDDGRTSRGGYDPDSVSAQISVLDEEIAVLRRSLQRSPSQSQTLEDRLRETEAKLSAVITQNERLAATLHAARDQIIALTEEVVRLSERSSPAD